MSYARIQYKACRVFGDGKGARIAHETDGNGNKIVCCYGAKTEPTDWGSLCEECKTCPKYIWNAIPQIGGPYG